MDDVQSADGRRTLQTRSRRLLRRWRGLAQTAGARNEKGIAQGWDFQAVLGHASFTSLAPAVSAKPRYPWKQEPEAPATGGASQILGKSLDALALDGPAKQLMQLGFIVNRLDFLVQSLRHVAKPDLKRFDDVVA